MMSILTRNVVMAYSLAVLCAALVGCSSDNDKSADLQRQLDMRADISPEDLAEIEEELEKFRMAQMVPEQDAMMRQQQEQARLDTMAAAGLEGGLARSPQARRICDERARHGGKSSPGRPDGLLTLVSRTASRISYGVDRNRDAAGPGRCLREVHLPAMERAAST